MSSDYEAGWRVCSEDDALTLHEQRAIRRSDPNAPRHTVRRHSTDIRAPRHKPSPIAVARGPERRVLIANLAACQRSVRDSPTSPEVAALSVMFPDVDKETLVRAVVHHAGDVNAAASTLLDSSSDPTGQDSWAPPGWECAICLDNEQDTPSCTLCCGHAFCRGCLHKWAKEAKQSWRAPACPCCRQAIGQKELDSISPLEHQPTSDVDMLDDGLSHRVRQAEERRRQLTDTRDMSLAFDLAFDLLMQRLRSGSAGSQLRSVNREEARQALRSADGNVGHAITYLIRTYRPVPATPTATVTPSNIPPATQPRPNPPARRQGGHRRRWTQRMWGLVTGRA